MSSTGRKQQDKSSSFVQAEKGQSGAGGKGAAVESSDSGEYHMKGSELKHGATEKRTGKSPAPGAHHEKSGRKSPVTEGAEGKKASPKVSPKEKSGSYEGKEAAGEGRSTLDTAREKLQEGWEYVKEKASDAVEAIKGATTSAGEGQSASPQQSPKEGGAKSPTGRKSPVGAKKSSPKSGQFEGASLKAGQSDESSKAGDVTGRGYATSGSDFSKSSTSDFSKGASDLKAGGQAQQKHPGGHSDVQGGKEKNIGKQEPHTGGRSHAQTSVGGQRY